MSSTTEPTSTIAVQGYDRPPIGGRWPVTWAVSALMMLAYLAWVGYPHARAQMGSAGLAPDKGVGLFPPWYATQQFLLHGRDPYSSEVAAETQERVYGRAADPAEGSLLRDEHRFAYPLYLALLLTPLVGLRFETAQGIVLVVLLGVTVASVRWWLRGLGLRVQSVTHWTLAAAMLGALAVQQGLFLQQLGLLAAALLAAALAAATSRRYLLAGVLLAVGSFKPQLAVGVTAWLLVWSLGDLPRRRGLLTGYALTLLILLGAATALMPDWIARWLQVVTTYPGYTGARPWLTTTLGWVGSAAGVIAIGFLLRAWWKTLGAEAGSAAFRRVTVLTIGLQMLWVPTWIGHNQILLVPIAAAAVVHSRQLWDAGVIARLVVAAGLAAVVWERGTAAALVAAWGTGSLGQASAAVIALPVYPLLVYPLLGAVLALTYARLSKEAQAATK